MELRTEQEIIDEILSMPAAPRIMERVSNTLLEEQQKREQFYNDITEFEKAEFINGEIVIHSPVKKEHNDALGLIFMVVNAFVHKNQLGYVGYEKVMVRLSRNDYEPDLCFFGREKSEGFTQGQSLFPAPDLVVEVLSAKTAANDRGIKFSDYEAHSVLEYWLVDPVAGWVEQYRLDATGRYELLLKAGSGPISCAAIPGFSTRIEAFFNPDHNLQELGRMLGA